MNGDSPQQAQQGSDPRQPMVFPSGKTRWVSESKMSEAVRLGAKATGATVNAQPMGAPGGGPPRMMPAAPFGQAPSSSGGTQSAGMTALGGMAQTGIDIAKGISRSPAGDISNVMQMVGAGGTRPGQFMQSLAEPKNEAQAFGKTLGQIGEAMTPVGEEALAARFGPRIAPYAAMLLRSLSMGGKEKLHGGDFVKGAETGAVQEVTGLGMQAIAPRILKNVFGVRDLHAGDAGKELMEGSGITRSKVFKNATKELAGVETELRKKFTAASGAGTVDTKPILYGLRSLYKKANQRERGQIASIIQTVAGHKPGETDLTLMEAEELRQKIERMVIWGKKNPNYPNNVATRVHDTLESDLIQAVPEAADAIRSRRGLKDIIEGTKESPKIGGGIHSLFDPKNLARAVPAFLGWEYGRDVGGLPGGMAGAAMGGAFGTPLLAGATKILANPLFQKGVAGSFLEASRDEQPKKVKKTPFDME